MSTIIILIGKPVKYARITQKITKVFGTIE